MLGALIVASVNADNHIPKPVLDTATQYLPGFKSDSVKPSPIPGLYRIIFGGNIIYMSEDGRYIVRGDVIDMEDGENLTELERNHVRLSAIEALGEESMIVFEPEQEVKGTVTVFTDITCAYCAKLHREVPQLNANGVRVRYLAFPRMGVPSPVAEDMISVWCADDPQKAMTDAKSGLGVESASCPNPVQNHFDLGGQVGVRGTPAILLEDGSMIGGYVPHARLTAAALQAHAQVAR